jgi:outer membrane receptor protein involved in Fe transport
MNPIRSLPACAALALATPSFAQGGSADHYQLQIARLPLVAALKEFSHQTGLQIGYLPHEAADGVVLSAPLEGQYTAEAALRQLLAPSGLGFERINERTIAVTAPEAATSGGHGDRVRIGAGPSQAPGWQPARLYLGEPQVGAVRAPLLALAQDVSAPELRDNPPQPRLETVEEIIVTGTHIRGAAPVGSRVMVIDREAIAASGYGRVQDLLETLPQNYSGNVSEDSNADFGSANLNRGQAIDLRGLGASSTLVLVNGRRQPTGGLQGSFVDISSIAASAVERIEIMADGASALYGSDAIGGVVNFVLRKDYDGIEAGVRLGTMDGAADDLQASFLLGKDWSSGNTLFGYQYSHRDALMAADAHWASYGQDYRALGGFDYRFAAGNPGTILDPLTGVPAYAIPAGQDGTNLTVADLIPGQANYPDVVTHVAALPEQEQHAAFASVSQDLGARLSVYAEGRFSQRRMTLPAVEPVALLFVPATNPFYVNPFAGDEVAVAYSFVDDFGAIMTQRSETTMYTLTGGVTTQLGAQWQMNAALTYGREKSTWSLDHNIKYERAGAALFDPDPATALNLFGDGAHTNPATIATLLETSLADGLSTLRNASVIADGPVLSLPAGTVRLALGADYRDERLGAHYASLAVATGEVERDDFFTVGEVRRDVTAFFGEVSIPVIGEPTDTGGRGVAVSIAGRYEDYSDFGSTFDPRIGLQVTPVRGVTLRGSWGTSFRAPRFNEMGILTQPASAAAASGVPDPESPTGLSNILYLVGGNPDLKEETAEIWTAGIELHPASIPDLSLTASYFDIAYQDKIQRAGDGATGTLLVEDQWREIVLRNPTQEQIDAVCNDPGFIGTCPANVAAIIDIRIQNIGRVDTRGIDFGADYAATLPLGRLTLNLSGTYVLAYERAVSASATPIDVLDTVSNPLDLRLRAGIGWEVGAWRFNAFVNHSDDYDDPVSERPVDSWTTVDLGVGYDFASGWLDGTVARLSATNVFDRAPPFANTFEGFDATNASDAGRTISLGISKSW